MPEERLRFVTYNIKGFGSGFWPEGKDPDEVAAAYGRIRDDLLKLKPEVLCLNEVVRFPFKDAEGLQREDSLNALAKDLGDMQVHFAHATPGFERFGNAVLVDAKLQVLGEASAHLEGGSVVKTKEGRDKKIVRSALAVRFQAQSSSPLSRMAVIATHLDHISSVERQAQVRDICRLQRELCDGFPHLLLGDFNALKRSDYSPEEWQAVVAKHEAKGWSPPEGCLSLQLLLDAGYVDLFEASMPGVGSMKRSLAEVPALAKMTASAADPDIRIDHVFCSSDLLELLQRQHSESPDLGTSAWVDTSASGSDHFPVVVDLPM